MTMFSHSSLCRMLAALILFGAFTLTVQAQSKTITPEKAVMMGYVEDFYMNNYRDVTMRKSLEWGNVKTDDKGNRTIRHTIEALIWDKERMILCTDFTFDKDGKFVSTNQVEGFPKPVVIEKPDTTSLEGVKKLVEKVFSQNFMDISARKAISWGELEKREDGSVSLVYRYEAAIQGGEKIVEERRFIFDKDGEFISCNRPTDELVTSLEDALKIEGVKRYSVNKNVSEFKYGDLSAPEEAYATMNKTLGSQDKDVVAKWDDFDACGIGKLSQRDIESIASKSDENAEKWKTANILEVCVYADQMAVVIAHLPGNDAKRPYDIRSLKKVGNQWHNRGNDMVDSPDAAIIKFARQVKAIFP